MEYWKQAYSSLIYLHTYTFPLSDHNAIPGGYFRRSTQTMVDMTAEHSFSHPPIPRDLFRIGIQWRSSPNIESNNEFL